MEEILRGVSLKQRIDSSLDEEIRTENIDMDNFVLRLYGCVCCDAVFEFEKH